MAARRLDVRGLEAPEPLERILAELELMEAGEQLEVTHWREPLLLYPILDARGWRHRTRHDEADDTWLIRIWKGAE
ncbi:MAG TPA: DUF2249 domain-containing protein [Gammaproteobacteria bacterium]|nr:DUF2249 domain-containing protein [Gammaproteobacteria bacterium]